MRIYIKNYLKECNQEPGSLKMLDTVLDLLQITVLLGLWQQISLLKELIPDLVIRITKIEKDVIFYKQPKAQYPALKDIVKENIDSLKGNRPQIIKLIGCKIKATNIFRLVN